MSSRKQIEENGFEALQRLYEIACRDTGQAGVVGLFLLGLYNGKRFPFDLTELRRLDDELFSDCMQVLAMDSRVTAREIHTYFDDGNLKFERMAFHLGVAQQPKKDLERSAGKGTITLRDGEFVRSRLVTYGSAPGYRDISIVLAIGEEPAINVDLNLRKDDAVRLMEHTQSVNSFAWREAKGPIDRREGEARPAWVADYS